MREISSSGWCAPVDVSAWTIPTHLARGRAASAAATASASIVSPPGGVDQVHEGAVALGHVRHPRAEHAGHADDRLVARLGQVGDAGLHAGAAGAGDRQRELVLGPEHLLQEAARLVHDREVLRIEVAERRRGQRRQHARGHRRSVRGRARMRCGERRQDDGTSTGSRVVNGFSPPCRTSSACRCPMSSVAQADAVLDRDRRRHARPLAGHRAAHHAAHGGVRDLVAGDAAAGHQQVLDLLRQRATP